MLGDTLESLLNDLIDLLEGARISGSRFSFSTRLRLTLFKLRVAAIKSDNVTLD